MSAIKDLLESDGKTLVFADEGESIDIDGSAVDLTDTAIVKAGLLSLTVTHYEEETGAVIASRNNQSILDANGGVVADPATFTWSTDPADMVSVNSDVKGGETEKHIVLFRWTWNDGVHAANREGHVRYRYRMTKSHTLT